MSSRGLPRTATKSASLPGSSVPVVSAIPHASAASAVVAVRACALVMPILGEADYAVRKYVMRLVGADAGVAAAHHSCSGAYEGGTVGEDGVESLLHRWEGRLAARKERGGHRDGHAASSELFQHVGVRVDSLGGEERAVLDRIHPRGQRIGDPLRAVRMRRDR